MHMNTDLKRKPFGYFTITPLLQIRLKSIWYLWIRIENIYNFLNKEWFYLKPLKNIDRFSKSIDF